MIVIGATNRPDLLDPGLTGSGRLDYILEFPMPPEADRADIFRVHTRGRPVGRGVDPAYLAGLTDGLSGSDIAAACRSAAMMAITACIGDGCDPKGPEEVLITQEIFEEAIKRAAAKKSGNGRQFGGGRSC